MSAGLVEGHTKVKLQMGSLRVQGILSGLVHLLFRELTELQHKEFHGSSEAKVLIVEPVNHEAAATGAIVWVEHCRVGKHCWDI